MSDDQTAKLPSIVWNKAAYKYISKIGYEERDCNGVKLRVRSYQTLGEDHHQAIRRALDLLDRWRWIVEFS